jgi:hypothetical protein
MFSVPRLIIPLVRILTLWTSESSDGADDYNDHDLHDDDYSCSDETEHSEMTLEQK